MEFYDTCALLNSYDSLQGKKFVISEISLKELEEIKSNRLKDEETKFKARQVSKVLLENAKNIEIVRFTEGVSKLWKINELADNNDGKIISETVFVPKGDPENPLERKDVINKLKTCAKGQANDDVLIQIVNVITESDIETKFINPMKYIRGNT